MSETPAQTLSRLTAFIQESAPTIDLSPGSVFSELILGLESQIQNQVYNDIDAISTTQAISQALNSVTDTYSPVIDMIASNYNVNRDQASASTGTIKVYVSTNTNSIYTLANGTTFIQPTLGYTYSTTGATSLNPSTFTSEGGGLYSFTVNVSSTTTGQQTALTNGTPFTLGSSSVIPNFVQAAAYGTFSPGLNQETDKQLIARFRTGLAVGNLVSSVSINNQLTSLYPGFLGAYLADTTSPVNIRSTSNLLSLKVPGPVDVYVNSSATIPQVTFQVVGTYLGSNVWQLTINETAAPGFYRILNITDAAATDLAYLPFTTTYSYDSSAPNLLQNAQSARYSIYQNATVNVTYVPPVDDMAITFYVTALAPYELSSIQALLLNPNQRVPCGDYLAKGIIPCMVSLSLNLVTINPGDVINTVQLQSDLFNYINSLSVGQSVAVSQIVKICHNYNIARVDLPILLSGKILAPYDQNGNATDEDIIIEGNDFLEIPNSPQYGVIPGNTMFFVSYFNDQGQQNINISIS